MLSRPGQVLYCCSILLLLASWLLVFMQPFLREFDTPTFRPLPPDLSPSRATNLAAFLSSYSPLEHLPLPSSAAMTTEAMEKPVGAFFEHLPEIRNKIYQHLAQDSRIWLSGSSPLPQHVRISLEVRNNLQAAVHRVHPPPRCCNDPVALRAWPGVPQRHRICLLRIPSLH